MLDYATQLMKQIISIEEIESAPRLLKLKEAK